MGGGKAGCRSDRGEGGVVARAVDAQADSLLLPCRVVQAKLGAGIAFPLGLRKFGIN
jgi:hypothetical protein